MPAADAFVVLDCRSGSSWTLTDAEGAYRFEGVRQGEYIVFVHHANTIDARTFTLPLAGESWSDFRLAPNRGRLTSSWPLSPSAYKLERSLLSVDLDEARLRRMPRTRVSR